MRTADADIFFVPGLAGADDDLWLSRWRRKLSTGRLVVPAERDRARLGAWTAALVAAAAKAAHPVVVVAHDLGVIAVAHAALGSGLAGVRGGFFVAPPAMDGLRALPGLDPDFAVIPTAPLPFPSVLVASRNDPLAPFAESEDLSYAWGAAFVDAGASGHIDAASGHGPWPEGLMRFASFLAKL